MKYIILSIFLLLPSISLASNTLSHKINWVVEKTTPNMKIKSTLALKPWKINKLNKMFINIKHSFFTDFENLNCNLDTLNDLELIIIKAKMLRNNDYFYNAEFNDFGRYFSDSHTIYIIYDVFNNPDYLAHELAHYFYDKCGIKFLNNKKEHIRVYKFQDFYWERE